MLRRDYLKQTHSPSVLNDVNNIISIFYMIISHFFIFFAFIQYLAIQFFYQSISVQAEAQNYYRSSLKSIMSIVDIVSLYFVYYEISRFFNGHLMSNTICSCLNNTFFQYFFSEVRRQFYSLARAFEKQREREREGGEVVADVVGQTHGTQHTVLFRRYLSCNCHFA